MTRTATEVIVDEISIWTHVGKETQLYKKLEPEARAIFAALALEGFTVTWCEEHNLPGVGPPVGECAHWALKAARPGDSPCRLTEYLLISIPEGQ